MAEDVMLKDYLVEVGLLRKPTHGSCCTCQACGQHHDDCICENATAHALELACIPLLVERTALRTALKELWQAADTEDANTLEMAMDSIAAAHPFVKEDDNGRAC